MHNAGKDWQAAIMGDTSSTATGVYAPATYMGFSASDVAPTLSDVSLEGELAGSLGRDRAVYAHTTGTSSYTLTRVAISDANVTLNKVALFNASEGGYMPFSTLIGAPPSLVPGDQIQHTITITISQP